MSTALASDIQEEYEPDRETVPTSASSPKEKEREEIAGASRRGDGKKRRKRTGLLNDDADGCSTSSSNVKDIRLLPTQIDHVSKLNNILDQRPLCLDLSMLGAGKTFSSTYIARQRGIKHVVVVSPVSVKPKWTQMMKEYGLQLTTLMGYTELRSVKCRQPRHGLLVRRDFTQTIQPNRRNLWQADPQARTIERVEFTATRRWEQMVEEGVILIFDEIQNLKNVSSQFYAARTLVSSIVDKCERDITSTKSRVMMLSGSPFDRVEQVTTFLRTSGIMKHDELGSFCPTTMRMVLRGMQDIIDYCNGIDSNTTRGIVGERTVFRSNMSSYAYKLFQEVIKPYQSSSMPPANTSYTVNKFNAFYDVIDPVERHRLSASIVNLASACMYDHNTGTVNFSTNVEGQSGLQQQAGSIQQVVTALLQVETAKIGTFERIAREILTLSANTKVSIHVNFNSTIKDLKQRLIDFDPIVLNGSVSDVRRGTLLEKYQSPDPRWRLLIGNVSVCSTGIDLDDKHGEFPRFVLVNPNYSIITLYQLGQRFVRADTKSNSTLHFVFGKHAHEDNVLKALAKKSSVMRTTTEDQVMAGVVYPGDYPEWKEDVTSESCDDHVSRFLNFDRNTSTAFLDAAE